MKTRKGRHDLWWRLCLLLAAAAFVIPCFGSCGSSTGGTSDGGASGSNRITGTVQAPTIGIFGNLASKAIPSPTKGLSVAGVPNATVCAYNLISGTKLGCATTDSSGNYSIENLRESVIVDPNNTAQARVIIEATTSDGLAVMYDYDDAAFSSTISAGTADAATTNAFVAGPLAEIRKIDATWKPGSGAAPSTFADRIKNGLFDPACEFVPYAAAFADSDVALAGTGLGGSLGVLDEMFEAALGQTTWNDLGFAHPADFASAAVAGQLTSAQIATWAADVAGVLGTNAATLEGNFSSALSVVTSLNTILGSVLASDVGLSSRSGRSFTLCTLLKTDAEVRTNWIDTFVKYSSTALFEKHWGTSAAMSAAAKLIEEIDENDAWSKFQPQVAIGALGDDFDASVVTDARADVGALLMVKGDYAGLGTATLQDVGADLWRLLLGGSDTELATMKLNPAYWIGYLLTYSDDLTGSTDFADLIDDIVDDADDVAVATCETDPKACVASCDPETPAEAALPEIAGSYAVTFGAATSNTCATGQVTCPAGTLVLSQEQTTLTCTHTPTAATTALHDAAGTISSSTWSCSPSRSGQQTHNCTYTETAAMGGNSSTFSINDTTITLTRASSSTAIDCAGIINASPGDTNTSCSYKCTTTATKQ